MFLCCFRFYAVWSHLFLAMRSQECLTRYTSGVCKGRKRSWLEWVLTIFMSHISINSILAQISVTLHRRALCSTAILSPGYVTIYLYMINWWIIKYEVVSYCKGLISLLSLLHRKQIHSRCLRWGCWRPSRHISWISAGILQLLLWVNMSCC